MGYDREAKREYMRKWREANPTYYKDKYSEMKEDEDKYSSYRERIKKWCSENPDKIKSYMKKPYAQRARHKYYIKRRNANNLPDTNNPGTIE
jgi:hypothetical protein